MQFKSVTDALIVNTTYGPIRGAKVDSMTMIFNGIPFAKPPIGDLRFASPEAPDPWNDTLDVSNMSFTPYCVQPTATDPENEDCLYLRVVTPPDAKYKETSYQVMVWIHGGSFLAGSGFWWMYDPWYWMHHIEDVIIVSINYRLGLFGFFYDNDYGTGVEGNFGLEDQMMAIEWVHDNIAYFGGDPSNINIFGESAGANSVALHLLYNNDHIASGIMQSPLLFQYGDYNEPKDYNGMAKALSDTVGCDETTLNASQLLDCWRSADIQDIVSQPFGTATLISVGAPTYNTSLFPNDIMTEFAKKNLEDIPPFIIGTNEDEAWFFTQEDWVNTPFDNYVLAQYYVDSSLPGYDNINITEAVLSFYNSTVDHPGSSGSYVYDLTTIFNDIWICHVRNILNNLNLKTTTTTGNVYYYNMDVHDFDLSYYWWNYYVPQCVNRTCHGQDVYYLWMPEDYKDDAAYISPESMNLTQSMQKYWFNFAMNHDPNMGLSVDVDWPSFERGDEDDNMLILEYKIDSMVMDTEPLRMEVCAFFDSIGYVPPFQYPRPESDLFDDENVTTGNGANALLYSTQALQYGMLLAVIAVNLI